MAPAYQAYSTGRQTLADLARKTGRSSRTLQRAFTAYTPKIPSKKIPDHPVALTFDATFFGRSFGVMIYRAQGRNIFWQEITSETTAGIQEGLRHLIAQGWLFSSVTIDGRKGVILLIESMMPGIPIQLCLFHQKAIIRRYLTTKPKTQCGQEIQNLAAHLRYIDRETCTACLDILWDTYGNFLRERGENGRFVHRTLRSALRSLKTNLPYLYTWQDHPDLSIPTTTNSCDGSFAHWKAKVKIHRGLSAANRSKMIVALLAHS